MLNLRDACVTEAGIVSTRQVKARPVTTVSVNSFFHRTKIVATLGPATDSIDGIRSLIRAGMNVARVNFSHGTHEEHGETIRLIRLVSEELNTPVSILQDLQGPKLRVGNLSGEGVELHNGDTITLVSESDAAAAGNPSFIPVDYSMFARDVVPDAPILLDDGLIELRVLSIDGGLVRAAVVQGGLLKSRKGVIFPTLELSIPALTEKDIRDLEFGVSQEVDWVALSFVRRAEDIMELREHLHRLGAKTAILAKIEKPQALDHLDEIIAVCNGLMVARGDLGLEMRPEQVPMAQKRIIRAANEAGIPVITATQMLESMITNPRPTRAEASDVANAILDGTDAVMLSAESAIGKYPIRAVEIMARIAREVEPSLERRTGTRPTDDIERAISEALHVFDVSLPLKCIVTFTTGGHTARFIAAERLKVPVIALTTEAATYRRVNLLWGVLPVLLPQEATSFDELLVFAEKALLEKKIAREDDLVLVTGGVPIGEPGSSNFIKLHRIGSVFSRD